MASRTIDGVTEFVERKTNEPLKIAVVAAELMALDGVESLQRYQLQPAGL